MSLLKKLCSVNLREGGDVEKHLYDMDQLFERLDAVDPKLDKICMLLRSLPPSFDGLVLALDSRSDDDLSLDVVKSKIADEFNRRLERDGAAGKGERAMRSAETKRSKETRTCHYCRKPGHLQRDCRVKKREEREKSPKPSASGSGKAKTANTDDRVVAFVAGNIRTVTWLIVSGATTHMTNDRSFFTSLEEFAGGWITLADGKQTQILGQGSGVLYGINGEGKVIRIYVRYVPGLSTNLISVTCLAKKKLNVSFDEEGCRIADQAGDIVATGFRSGGLYHLRLAESSMQASAGQHLENCHHQWHRRLGHRDWAAVERINREQLATGMKVVDCGIKPVCECCLQGKSARLPFPPVVERKSTQILDIVHTDPCGPMKNVTPSGNRHKSDAADHIKDYVKWAANLFNRKPRVIRSDGGGEFDNGVLRQFYKVEGTTPQFTTPYSPKQNGVAERKNRSLTEMTTCILIDAGLPKCYWGEAMLTATYLQNRLPSRSLQKIPYELWWERKPELGHIRVFGSEAFVHIPDVKRSKLEGKARKMKMIGYSMNHKGYRFLDPETETVIVSRDARFIELGNGTSVVEISVSKPEASSMEQRKDETPPEEPPEPTEEQLGTEGGDNSFSELFEDAEAEDHSDDRRRSTRQNLGANPKYLEDYELDSGGLRTRSASLRVL